MKLKDAVAKRINELRNEQSLSVHALSIKAGVANSTVTDIVKANNESVQIKFIYGICEGLDISLTEFFTHPYFDKSTLTD